MADARAIPNELFFAQQMRVKLRQRYLALKSASGLDPSESRRTKVAEFRYYLWLYSSEVNLAVAAAKALALGR